MDKKPDDAIQEIVEKQILTSSIKVIAGVVIGFAVFVFSEAIYSTYTLLTDRTIPLVSCPRVYDMDAPIVMNTISNEGPIQQDRWIRGFMRRFIVNQFPRTPEDAEKGFKYVVDHSYGAVERKYKAFLGDISTIRELIRNGHYFKFYPSNSLDMRIRKSDASDIYLVEIDGFLVKRAGNIQERFTPTLRYKIKLEKSTIDNPEGIYVLESSIDSVIDYVSGRKE